MLNTVLYAKTTLEAAGLAKAFEVFEDTNAPDKYEERTVKDIVGKLVRYGSISDKAMNYVKVLVEKIDNRPALEAKRAAEHDAAKPVPTGRMVVKGKVLAIKENFGPFPGYRMLVVHADGWKVYGTLPRAISHVEREAEVEFTATVKPSDNDTKFGFFSRPTNARIL